MNPSCSYCDIWVPSQHLTSSSRLLDPAHQFVDRRALAAHLGFLVILFFFSGTLLELFSNPPVRGKPIFHGEAGHVASHRRPSASAERPLARAWRAAILFERGAEKGCALTDHGGGLFLTLPHLMKCVGWISMPRAHGWKLFRRIPWEVGAACLGVLGQILLLSNASIFSWLGFGKPETSFPEQFAPSTIKQSTFGRGSQFGFNEQDPVV